LKCIDQLQKQGKDLNRYVFVWDKARSHYLANLRDIKKHINFMFRPTASPDIMPIEMAFSKWKYNIRRMILKFEDELVYQIAKESKQITKDFCVKICNHCIKKFDKCLDKEDFGF